MCLPVAEVWKQYRYTNKKYPLLVSLLSSHNFVIFVLSTFQRCAHFAFLCCLCQSQAVSGLWHFPHNKEEILWPFLQVHAVMLWFWWMIPLCCLNVILKFLFSALSSTFTPLLLFIRPTDGYTPPSSPPLRTRNDRNVFSRLTSNQTQGSALDKWVHKPQTHLHTTSVIVLPPDPLSLLWTTPSFPFLFLFCFRLFSGS